jgi:hypothetical protein
MSKKRVVYFERSFRRRRRSRIRCCCGCRYCCKPTASLEQLLPFIKKLTEAILRVMEQKNREKATPVRRVGSAGSRSSHMRETRQ